MPQVCARRPPSETRLPSGGGRRWRRRRRDRARGLRSPRPAALVDRRRGRRRRRRDRRGRLLERAHDVPRADARSSIGTPYTATGGAPITSAFCTSPIAPATLIKQDSIRQAAERTAGLEAGALKGHASSQPVAGAVTKLNFTPAVNIVVQGPFKGDKTARAADALAEGVQTACSKYALEREKTTGERLEARAGRAEDARPPARPGPVDAQQGAGRQVALGDRPPAGARRSRRTPSRTSRSARISSTSSSARTSRCSSRCATSS